MKREDFAEQCLRRLGAPVINIVIDPTQVEDAIDDALYLFFSRHMDATEEKHTAHFCTDGEVSTGIITMPVGTQSVTAIWRNGSGSSSSVFGVPYQIFLDDYLSGQGMYGTNASMFDFYLTTRHVTMLNDFFNPDVRFNYNKLNRKLRISGLDLSRYQTFPLIIQSLDRIATQAEIDGTEESVIWDDNWLQEYATAQMKRQFGTNMKKFENVQLLGGATMSGTQIFQEAEEELRQLQEQLQMAYEMPVDMEIG